MKALLTTEKVHTIIGFVLEEECPYLTILVICFAGSSTVLAGVTVDGSPTLAAGVRSTPAAKVGLAAGSPLDLGMVSCIHRQ